MISLCITHRIQEDISWVEDLYADLLIYNKGKEWDLPYTFVKSPKIKNEVDTYIRGIIDSYENLHKYHWVFFLKPNCKDYNEDIISFLSINQYNQIPFDQIIPLSKNNLDFNFENYFDIKENDKTSENSLQKLNHIYNVMNTLGLEMKGRSYPYCPGSQYRVPVNFILCKPKSWWILLHSYVTQMNEFFDDEISEYFEILWPLIFMPK